LDPGHAAAHANLGAALLDRRNPKLGATHLERALALDPSLSQAAYNLGTLKIGQRQWEAAARLFRQSLDAAPKQADAQYWLGNALMGMGDAVQARKAYQAALRIDSNLVQARWGNVMAQLPAIALLPQEQEESAAAFARELDKARTWFRTHRPSTGYQAVGSQQPFYLAYIEQDHRAVLREYGELSTSLMGAWARKVPVPAPAARREGKIRVGVVSAHIHNHSVWHAVLRGWVEHLDREQFTLEIFHVGEGRDAETEWAARQVARLHHGLGDWMAWAKAVSDGRFDVLIYPEIGMDATTVRLSALRLARVQLASWGHPVTTGLPTIDGYISAQAFEQEGSQDHYNEPLLALPRLGCSYRAYGTRPRPVDLAALGVAPGDRILLCAGNSFKYAPRDDQLYVEIARRCQPCKLLFFSAPGDLKAKLLQDRLRQVFAAADMDFDASVRFVPWLAQEQFFGLLQQAHVFLDSPGFSGFNTAMQAVECDTPIVAWEGRFMRGRFASGILGELGMTEWIAASHAGYADLVLALCDTSTNARVRQQLRERKARLFDDKATVDALATQLRGLAQGS
ncbi:MAG: tetratricopeptide repeat protein, partial [Comamonadaceae bacterium]